LWRGHFFKKKSFLDTSFRTHGCQLLICELGTLEASVAERGLCRAALFSQRYKDGSGLLMEIISLSISLTPFHLFLSLFLVHGVLSLVTPRLYTPWNFYLFEMMQLLTGFLAASTLAAPVLATHLPFKRDEFSARTDGCDLLCGTQTGQGGFTLHR
jgi:hypothetical protein